MEDWYRDMQRYCFIPLGGCITVRYFRRGRLSKSVKLETFVLRNGRKILSLTSYQFTKEDKQNSSVFSEAYSAQLSLNVAKTQSMLVSTKVKRKTLDRSSQHLQVKINGTELEVVSKIKYLGVLLDNSLDWKDQVQAVSLKVSRGLGILKHAKKFLPFSALTSLYTSIVEPHFRYCCSVWGCAGTTEIDRLQKLQNRAARIVTNSSFDTPSNKLIEKLGWKTVNELIDIESKTIVFKSLNELAPPYLRSLFRKNSQSTSYRLRNTSTDLRLPKIGTEKGKKSFSFRGAKLWNSLSANCKQAASLSTFEEHI